MAGSRGDEATQRAQELLRREAELAAGRGVTQQDVKRAAELAELASERDREAHRRELDCHYQAAAAHERAAAVHERAADVGVGDIAAHRRAAEREREAARRDLLVAQSADRQHT